MIPFIATIPRRMVAAILDTSIVLAIVLLYWTVIGFEPMVAFAILFFYHVVSLVVSGGSSPGRAGTHLRVVDRKTFHRPSVKQIVIRSLVRPTFATAVALISFSLPIHLVSVEAGVILIFLIPSCTDLALMMTFANRAALSDEIAKTVVVVVMGGETAPQYAHFQQQET